MGGLAARSYLQLFSRLSHSAHNVLKLITVGTPHKGANIVELCKSSDICRVLGITPSSIALAELDPSSLAMQVLNDLIHHPLPSEVSYTSIIGRGTFVLGDGDGIVSASSQNLGNVIAESGAQNLHHTSKVISVGNCPILGFILPQVHTCETSDSQVLTEVLNHIYECDFTNSGDTVSQDFGVPWNFFTTPPNELVLKAFCFASGVMAQIHKPSSIQHHFTHIQGHQWNATLSRWEPFTLQCDEPLVSNAWCPGNATANLNSHHHFFIAYACSWVNNQWKCGCRDEACTTWYWQLQKFQP